ncbi:hypothetical protein [Megasphaera sp. BL7]|uniref:hypothetical protein n=1 Tax=Megasphaera sp. BL7 TaxID=1285585 RepID=UPI0019552BFE|nr:hypothetical protein [Megasphaera sp. BL7]
MAFGFDLRKYRSRRDTDRLQQHYLEKEETTHSSLLKKKKQARLIKVRLKTGSWHFSRK